MKKVFCAAVLALVSILTCVFFMIYIMNVSDKAIESVNKIQQDFSYAKYQSAFDETENLDKFWEENHTMLSIIVHHESLEEIEETIATIKSSITNADNRKNENFWLESNKALVYLKNLREVEIPSLGNVL